MLAARPAANDATHAARGSAKSRSSSPHLVSRRISIKPFIDHFEGVTGADDGSPAESHDCQPCGRCGKSSRNHPGESLAIQVMSLRSTLAGGRYSDEMVPSPLGEVLDQEAWIDRMDQNGRRFTFDRDGFLEFIESPEPRGLGMTRDAIR